MHFFHKVVYRKIRNVQSKFIVPQVQLLAYILSYINIDKSITECHAASPIQRNNRSWLMTPAKCEAKCAHTVVYSCSLEPSFTKDPSSAAKNASAANKLNRQNKQFLSSPRMLNSSSNTNDVACYILTLKGLSIQLKSYLFCCTRYNTSKNNRQMESWALGEAFPEEPEAN